MEVIKTFLLEHYDLVISCVAAIVVIILQIVKKKPIEILPTIQALIDDKLPSLIQQCEHLFKGVLSSKDKKQHVVDTLMAEIERLYPLTESAKGVYKYIIGNKIEDILACPQKK